MTLNSTRPFPVISAADSAIDTEAMTDSEMLAYLQQRDISAIKLRAGQRAAVFHLREVSHEDQANILETCTTQTAREIRAFRAAVVEVTDCRFSERERGRWEPADKRLGLTADEAKLFTMATILEVGAVAWARSFLGPANVRQFAPPQWLLAHLAALPYRSAEPSSVATSSAPASTTPVSTGRDVTAHAEPCESPTVAHATVENSPQAA